MLVAVKKDPRHRRRRIMSKKHSTRIRRTTAALGVAALVAAPIAVAAPAHADGKDREFRVAGAEVEVWVERDEGRF
jgi:hypothetical protein